MTALKRDLRPILAVDAHGLPAELTDSRFLRASEAWTMSTLTQAGLWIGPRGALESNDEYRQIIPYVLLQYGDGFLRYTRTSAGGEARLHGRTSIGLGGHVDLGDVKVFEGEIDLHATLAAAADREIKEEIGDVVCESREWIGVLLDNSSAVGRVHLGVIGRWRIRDMPNGLAEDAIGNVVCCTVDELVTGRELLEGWSTMLLPSLEAEAADVPSGATLTR